MAALIMTEDDIYRASTQFRLWSFTPTKLHSLRTTTNSAAATRVHLALNPSVECLTPTEELALVTYYTNQLLLTSDLLKLPSQIKATGAQFLKRFYLSNSPMTYHPKNIFPTCLFLATKTDNHYIGTVERFAENLNEALKTKKKVTGEDVIAAEFVLTQGLRFTFDIKQPGRGLTGGLMELIAMDNGKGAFVPTTGRHAVAVQKELLSLPLPTAEENGAGHDETSAPSTVKDLELRCRAAGDTAKETLTTAALLTDVYFHYTPAQIWLAALLLADSPLAFFYLSTKFPPNHIPPKLISVIKECAEMLEKRPVFEAQELKRIDKKLYMCQNPEKIDLVELNKAGKRNEKDAGMQHEEGVKKRRMEREKGKREGDVFGGPLPAAAS